MSAHRLGTLRMFFVRIDGWGWDEAPARVPMFPGHLMPLIARRSTGASLRRRVAASACPLGHVARRSRRLTPAAEAEPSDAAVPEERALRSGRGTGQEIAAVTSSTTLFSTAEVHFWSAYDTGHRSPASRFAVSWKPKVEYR
jgi:hypothetical protein